MKKTILFLFFCILTPSLTIADIMPQPSNAAEYFQLVSERVDIEITKKDVQVKGLFNLFTRKLPTRQYCSNYPNQKGPRCSPPYYQFEFLYPIQKGEKFTYFNVLQDGEKIPSYDSFFDSSYFKGKRESGDYMVCHSKRVELKEMKFPYRTNIKIEYAEPIKFQGNKANFTYVLKTGAFWKGKIKEAKIFLKSEYKIESSIKPTKIKGQEFIWEFKNLTPKEDLKITIIN